MPLSSSNFRSRRSSPIVNTINEIRLGSIGLNAAAVQWTIESTIVAAFVYLMRNRLFVTAAAVLAD